MTAAYVDKISEAVTFLKIAKMKVPDTDGEYIEKTTITWHTAWGHLSNKGVPAGRPLDKAQVDTTHEAISRDRLLQ